MRPDKTVNGSPSIEHDPNIKKAMEYHNLQSQQQKKMEDRIILLIMSSLILISTLGILFFYVRYTPKSLISSEFLKLSQFYIMRCTLVVFSYYFFFSCILIFRSKIKADYPEHIFLYSFFLNFSDSMARILALIFVIAISPSAKLRDCAFNHPGKIKNVEISSFFQGFNFLKDENKDTETKIYLGLVASLVLIFIGGLVLFFLNFNVHYNYFEKRINDNYNRISLLRTINERIGMNNTDEIEMITEKFVSSISKDGGNVYYDDLVKLFDEDTSQNIVNSCFENDDHSKSKSDGITTENLDSLYYNTLLEQTRIVNAIDQNNETVTNFTRILNMILYPSAVLIFIKSSGLPGLSKYIDATFLGALIISTSYSFSDIIKSFLFSLNFIFFIRPYEIDDIIIMDDKIYKVEKINLLTSVFIENKNTVIVQNSSISGRFIKNLRFKRTKYEEFSYNYDATKFEENKDKLLTDINTYLKKSPSKYRKNAYFSSIKITDVNKIAATLTVGFNLDSFDLNLVRERHNAFLFVLNDMLIKNNLRPFEQGKAAA